MNKSRAILVFFSMCIFLAMILIGLFRIQVKDHEKYKYLAERQQYKTETIIPVRGTVMDRNGDILAYSKKSVSYFVDVRMMNEDRIDRIVKKFAEVFKKRESYYKSLIKRSKKNVKIEGNVSDENIALLKSFVAEGLFSEEESKRFYPYGEFASHLLGYVDTEGKGKDGIENRYEPYLKGEEGKRLLERDVLGRTVSVMDNLTQPAKNGSTLVLTINRTYQSALEESLVKGLEQFGGKSAIGILMDPNSGEILALASAPFYNPANYNAVNNEIRRNIALTDTYEPGSTFKAIIMSAILNEGLAKEKEMINTENGIYKVKGAKIKDTHEHSMLSVREVMEQSSNIGMVKLVDRIDDNTLYKYVRDFGFGNSTNIDLPGETDGFLKKPSNYSKISKYFLSFGYEVSVTPIQMCAAFSALVNGGTLYKPYAVKEIRNSYGNISEENSPLKIRNVISKETSALIKDFMIDVVEKGTAKMARLENVLVGGKTGTSQKLVDNKYSKSHYNSSFIGFFPAENPKVVCFILVNSPQNGKYGGTVAAPIFKMTAQRILEADESLVPQNTKEIKRNDMFDKFMADIKEENEVPMLLTSNYSEESDESENTDNNLKSMGYMPDLQNKSVREAISMLTRLGIKYKITGSGNISAQSIKPGKKINAGQVCLLECSSNKKTSTIKLN
ncbi:MAG: transpeptidase family protein [Ignavibacteria bacterium]|mgnify:CR=1 FL=1|nr:transpeptidase family protein [Ignavibacteria bacterium]